MSLQRPSAVCCSIALLLTGAVSCTGSTEPDPPVDVLFSDISVGLYTAFLSTDAEVYVVGETPIPLDYAGSPLVRISAGSDVCGLTAVGNLLCWGAEEAGSKTLGPIPLDGGRPVISLSVGLSYACAVLNDGSAWCWGENETGQLGDGTNIDRPLPVRVAAPPGVTFSSISVYQYHSCGLTPAGKVWCWGLSDSGQLGNGIVASPYQVPIPVQVTMPGGLTFTRIATGVAHSCGLTAAGEAWCWGFNHRGRLGDGTVLDRWIPTAVQRTELVPFVEITAGRDHTCALTDRGAAYCWGRGMAGRLGDGYEVDRYRPSPVAMPQGISFIQLSAGFGHTCGRDASGGAWCWGLNSDGRLGDGTTTNQASPVRVRLSR